MPKNQFCQEKNCSIIGCLKCIQDHYPEHQKYKKLSENLLSKYEFLKRLGEGGSGIVFKVRSFPQNKEIALKIIYLHEILDEMNDPEMTIDSLKELITREIVIHKELNHDNIIKYYDSSWLGKEKLFLIEKLENWELAKKFAIPALDKVKNEVENKKKIAKWHEKLGDIESRLKNWQKALDNYKRALILMNDSEDLDDLKYSETLTDKKKKILLEMKKTNK